MSEEKDSRKAVRTPNSWGLRAANRVEERISVVHNRLGFDLGKSWELIGLETYEGKIYLADFFFTTCPTICPVMKKQMLRVFEK